MFIICQRIFLHLRIYASIDQNVLYRFVLIFPLQMIGKIDSNLSSPFKFAIYLYFLSKTNRNSSRVLWDGCTAGVMASTMGFINPLVETERSCHKHTQCVFVHLISPTFLFSFTPNVRFMLTSSDWTQALTIFNDPLTFLQWREFFQNTPYSGCL